jgi:serine/threonine protein kinase
LDSNGNAKICDFGGCKRMTENELAEDTTGTTLYRSPESLNSYYLNYSLDFWSFGICVYLMLTGGEYPFDKDEDVENLNYQMPDPNEKILIKDEKNKINKISCDFVSKLLNKNLNERLILKEAIKIHPFFSKIDWNQLENGKKSPILSMNECGICLEEKLSKDKFIKLKNCDHQVCKTCYDNIMKTNPKCPFCAKWFDKPIGR